MTGQYFVKVNTMAGAYRWPMNATREQALDELGALGFRGRDVYLAELIVAVEMAWADGEIQPEERAMLEAYCEDLVIRLNQQVGAPFFTLSRALTLLDRISRQRLRPVERQRALAAIKTWAGITSSGESMKARMVDWAEAVGAAGGWPRWDTRELFWLQTLRRELLLIRHDLDGSR
jgi:hypothetical protein